MVLGAQFSALATAGQTAVSGHSGNARLPCRGSEDFVSQIHSREQTSVERGPGVRLQLTEVVSTEETAKSIEGRNALSGPASLFELANSVEGGAIFAA
jgi:hypothetical protein